MYAVMADSRQTVEMLLNFSARREQVRRERGRTEGGREQGEEGRWESERRRMMGAECYNDAIALPVIVYSFSNSLTLILSHSSHTPSLPHRRTRRVGLQCTTLPSLANIEL